jgi:hypothetical protein
MKIKKLNFAIDFQKLDFMAHARKMFGKMRELLRDTGVVCFEVSVKLYLEGSEEPRTISMEGERSASGGWNTRSPRVFESKALESPTVLREEFCHVEAVVRSYIVENALDEDWREIAAALRELMKSGTSVDALESHTEIPIRAIANFGYDAHLYAPLMATAYVIEGAQALTENNLEHASYCVERGRHWSSTEMLIPDPRYRFTDRASMGGHGKASNYEPVKAKVIELLSELEPDGGWTSERAAIERVADELATKPYLRLVGDCGLKYYNLTDTVKVWIRRQPERFRYNIRPEV